MIAAGSFKFNDCVEGEIKAVYLVNFLLKPVKCVTCLSKGSLFSQCLCADVLEALNSPFP